MEAEVNRIVSLLPPQWTQGRSARLSPLDFTGTGSIFRLTLDGAHDSKSFIVKTVKPAECGAHRLVCSELSEITPRLYSWGELAPGRQVLLMEDLATRVGGTPIDLSTFHAALRLLSAVHDRFVDKRSRLETASIVPASITPTHVAEGLCAASEMLQVLAPLLEVPIDNHLLRELRSIAGCLEAETRQLADERSWTLVHGDFHFGNILGVGDAQARIVDWGFAAIQNPAWDLVMCSEPEVAYYLSCERFGAIDERRFFRNLKASVLYRLASFVCTASAALMGEASQLPATLAHCLKRLVDTAASTSFSGGRAVRFVASSGNG